VTKPANAPLRVVLKPGAELRGVGAQLVDAETAPLIPASRIAEPAGRSGDNPSPSPVSFRPRWGLPARLADVSRF
jgi:hypothetical protein